MSRMFVANATKQNVDFVYRLPESTNLRSQTIPIGRQVPLAGDLTKPEIDAIIAQYSKYGLIEASTIDQSRTFHGLCYSIDKPVPSTKMRRLLDQNMAVLKARGKQMREEAAVNESLNLENMLTEGGRTEELRNFEMSVVVEDRDEADTSPEIAEGVRVTRDEDRLKQGGFKPRGRRNN